MIHVSKNAWLDFILVLKKSYCKKKDVYIYIYIYIYMHYVYSVFLFLLMPVDFLALNYYITMAHFKI